MCVIAARNAQPEMFASGLGADTRSEIASRADAGHSHSRQSVAVRVPIQVGAIPAVRRYRFFSALDEVRKVLTASLAVLLAAGIKAAVDGADAQAHRTPAMATSTRVFPGVSDPGARYILSVEEARRVRALVRYHQH